jgi:drug/metabolite transporter (DMT)-like permease
MPSAISTVTARERVTGLMPHRRTKVRLEGSRLPGPQEVTSARSNPTTTSKLLSLFMKTQSSAIDSDEEAIPTGSPLARQSQRTGKAGTVAALLGVASFSLSFPATVWATEGMGPWTATGARGLLAGVLAIALLTCLRVRPPRRQDLPGLLVVAAGCVIGFPLLTTLALQTSTTAHSAVIIGLLPLATASVAALRTKHRLPGRFWAAATTGAAAVVVFALSQHHGAISIADLYLLAALTVCALGYAEGGRLAGHLPGWHVIAWAVVLALPVSLAIALFAVQHEPLKPTPTTLWGLAYLAGISQLGGFVVWYRGMGIVGVAKASQLQLAQPLLTLVWSVLLMGEHLPLGAPITAAVVLLCIAITQRAHI